MTTLTLGRSSIVIGFSNGNGFPKIGNGEALLKTGSVTTIKPSIFITIVECPNQTNLPTVKLSLLNFIVGRDFNGFLSLAGEIQSFKLALFSEARRLASSLLTLTGFKFTNFSELKFFEF